MTDTTTGAPSTADAELAAFAQRVWDEQLAAHPVFATSLGDRRFDHLLRANGLAALETDERRLRALRAEAEGLPVTDLGPVDLVTRATLLDFLDYELGLVASGLDAWNVDPLDGPQVTYLNIPSFQPVRTTDEGEALVARWREIGPWVDRLVETTRSAVGEGLVAPHALVRSVVAELDDLLARPTATWPLAEPADNPPGDWPEEVQGRFSTDVRTAVDGLVRPAFARYRAFLADEIAPIARGDDRPGLSHVPNGLAAYRKLVRAHTTLELEPEEIHRIGHEETERIDAEFRNLGSRLLGTSDLAAVLERLRTDPDLSFRTPDEVFAVAEQSLARANAAVPGWFGRLPTTECVVVEMAAHEAEHSTIAYYRQPAADGSRPGCYYNNTATPETRPR